MSGDEPDTIPPWGPKMAALANDKQRAFVCFLFEAPRALGRITWAARAAGYGSPTSSDKSLSVIASRLNLNEKIQAAIAEESVKRARSLSPGALGALERLLDKPKHKDHARAIAMVLDRSDPVETTHHVVVEDTRPPAPADIERVLARIEELARRAGIAPPPRTIETEFKVVGEEAARA